MYACERVSIDRKKCERTHFLAKEEKERSEKLLLPTDERDV